MKIEWERPSGTTIITDAADKTIDYCLGIGWEKSKTLNDEGKEIKTEAPKKRGRSKKDK